MDLDLNHCLPANNPLFASEWSSRVHICGKEILESSD